MEFESQKHVPKHATLSPKKSCLKPSSPRTGTPRTGTSTDSDDDVRTEAHPKEFKWVRLSNLVKVIDIDGRDDFVPNSRDEELHNTETKGQESSLEFIAQDQEINRLLNRATSICDANEKASIIRGSLDFLMVVYNRVDPENSDGIDCILERLGPRSIGSYVDDEREFANCYEFTCEVPQSLYRDKETSMSWKRQETQ
ncbi:uncharacterized protein FTOL_02309 [Fusarium torulosum]|uniref:Uncharacterized protein n=1 Tax=Fusarium torulosum TaxID=33205 RepID=A0AAE8M1P9_9HYPO|nr:uncharacterized protein FTOL_02309 [Fusarium torulosum]